MLEISFFSDENFIFLLLKKKNLCILHGQVFIMGHFEPRRGKANIVVSDQVRHKPACTVTEDGYQLEIPDLRRRGVVLSV